MTDSALLSAFAIPQVPYAYTPQPNPCENNGANPGGWEEECVIGSQSLPAFSLMSDEDHPSLTNPTGLAAVTVLGMRPETFEGGGGWSLYLGGDTGSYGSGGGGFVTAQQYYADDFNRWKRNRSKACDDSKLLAAGVLGSVSVSIAACIAAIPSIGLTLAACGGGYILTAVLVAQHNNASRACAAPYPGPRNW